MPNSTPLTVTGTVTANISTTPATFLTRSDTFTIPGIGQTVDASAFVPHSYSIQVKGTGAPATSWTAQIEVSLDNINFTTIMTHTTNTGDGVILLSGANLYPASYFRTKINNLVLGSATNIVVTIIGKG